MAMMKQDFVGSNQLRNDERKGLSPDVRLVVKAYVNIPGKIRPFPPQTPGIFLHIGKAGGSFLCQRLRWSCHHFMVEKLRYRAFQQREFSEASCKTIANETYFSHVSTYMHIPDFYLFKRGIYKVGQFLFYTASTRDPISRFISTYSFMDPKNNFEEDPQKKKGLDKCYQFYECFPTLEQFSELVGDNPQDYDYPYAEGTLVTKNCTNLAKAVINGHYAGCNKHMSYNIKQVLEIIPEWQEKQIPTLMLLRMEFMGQDFATVNQVLGDPTPIDVASFKKPEKGKFKVSPIKTTISDVGRRRLCFALLPDYEVYFQALSIAVNLSYNDKLASLYVSQRNCPELTWLFETAPKILKGITAEHLEATTKRHLYKPQIGDKVLKLTGRLGDNRVAGPYRVEAVHANETINIRIDDHSIENIEVTRVKSYSLANE